MPNGQHFSQGNTSTTKKIGIYPPVFYPALVIALLLLGIGVFWPQQAEHMIEAVKQWMLWQVGWVYVLGAAIILGICLFLMLSRLGDVKLGPDHSTPEFSNLSWFSMLFAAGIGVGLMFFGIAEPLMHYLDPPPYVEPQTIESARTAMEITFFHWGLQAWAIYGVVALSLSYFSYRCKLPLLPRSVLYPFVGEKLYGPMGHAVDIFAVVSSVFGVATSLGFGAIQINAGLHFLFDIPDTLINQILAIGIIVAIATVSVILGLEKGIKRLSNMNILLAVLLALFVLLNTHIVALLQFFVQNLGTYFSGVIYKTFNLYAYSEQSDWVGGWTVFYWAWWISCAPFVGMFIARVSKGRTVREFLIGVLFAPLGFTFLWMTVFGNTAIDLVENSNATALANIVQNNTAATLFEFLTYFPLSKIVSSIALLLIVLFFVTSIDSIAIVLDTITSGSTMQSAHWQRACWPIATGTSACLLLYSGGLSALQTATIVTALPLLAILLLMGCSLIKALNEEHDKLTTLKTYRTSIQYEQSNEPWQNRLKSLLTYPEKKKASIFIPEVVAPALQQVCGEMKQNGVEAYLNHDKKSAELRVFKDGMHDFIYKVTLCASSIPDYADVEESDDVNYYRAEVFLSHGGQHYDIMGYSEGQIITDVITQYEKHLHFLYLTSL